MWTAVPSSTAGKECFHSRNVSSSVRNSRHICPVGNKMAQSFNKTGSVPFFIGIFICENQKFIDLWSIEFEALCVRELRIPANRKFDRRPLIDLLHHPKPVHLAERRSVAQCWSSNPPAFSYFLCRILCCKREISIYWSGRQAGSSPWAALRDCHAGNPETLHIPHFSPDESLKNGRCTCLWPNLRRWWPGSLANAAL